MTVRLYYNTADARAKASSEWHEEWISKSGLKARLWTDKAISEFLGAPLNAGPVKAWKQKEVKKAEATPAFKTWLEQRRAWLVAGHFGIIGKSDQEIFQVIEFNFVDNHRKIHVFSELISEHARGWTSPTGESASHSGVQPVP